MHRVLLLVACVLGACVLGAGCTTTVEGSPSAPSGVLLPPRPREVRLEGVDPCSLLTPEQRARLGLNSEPRLERSYVDLFRGEVSTCALSGPSPSSVLLGITAVTTVGIERWRESDVAVTLRPTVVAGFPAVVAKPTRYADYCSVEVDVAAGQLVDVQFGGGSQQAPIPQDELCRHAERSAAEVMKSLLVH